MSSLGRKERCPLSQSLVVGDQGAQGSGCTQLHQFRLRVLAPVAIHLSTLTIQRRRTPRLGRWPCGWLTPGQWLVEAHDRANRQRRGPDGELRTGPARGPEEHRVSRAEGIQGQWLSILPPHRTFVSEHDPESIPIGWWGTIRPRAVDQQFSRRDVQDRSDEVGWLI